eukprot:scaffold1663_cov171-Amphora_coffeaeformis.AAC.25
MEAVSCAFPETLLAQGNVSSQTYSIQVGWPRFHLTGRCAVYKRRYLQGIASLNPFPYVSLSLFWTSMKFD